MSTPGEQVPTVEAKTIHDGAEAAEETAIAVQVPEEEEKGKKDKAHISNYWVSANPPTLYQMLTFCGVSCPIARREMASPSCLALDVLLVLERYVLLEQPEIHL